MNSEPNLSSTPDYTMGYDPSYLDFVARFSIRDILNYLMPHFRSGMRVLDVGCGEGRLSPFLVEAITPGKLYAVDIEPTQVETARQVGVERNLQNMTVTVGDALQLPFEDGFFDLVHYNDVMAYIPDTLGALAEVKRVLKPGGILGCREMIINASFAYPEELTLGRRAWEVFMDLMEADEAHPNMGSELKMRLHEAEFTDVAMSASFEIYSAAADIQVFSDMVMAWFLSPHITEAAKKYGAATDRIFDRIAEGVEFWREHPGAIAGVAFGQAVAVRR